MAAIKLCEDELTALFGLPHLSIVLYVLGLRPRMDYAKGTVGERPLISWQALREATYVEPHPGIKHEYASVEAIRRAAVWLEKVGLIQMRSRDRQLVFFLPKAHADFSVRNKADSTPTDQADSTPTGQKPHKQTLTDDFIEQSRQTEIEKADEHPVSGKPNIKTSSTPLTRTDSKNQQAGEGEVLNFVFPKTMTSQQRAAIALKTTGLGLDIGQAVIDELAGCMQAGTVKNLAGLTRHFVKQAETGDFMPDKGVSVKAARESQAALERQRAADERKATEQAAQTVGRSSRPPSMKKFLQQLQREK